MAGMADKNVIDKTGPFTGKDVKDTNMLKGTAQDSLFGKNVTKQDTRSGGKSEFGATGGMPKVK